MDFALSTLVLFLFLAPGIAFRRFYFSEEFSKQYFKQSFFELFVSTLLPSIVFQTIWFFAAKITAFTVDLSLFVSLLTGESLSEVAKNLESYSKPILAYQFSLISIAGVSGYISRKIIRFFKLDRTRKIFRFQNSWHYQLTGEFFDFPRADINLKEDTVEAIEFVFVDTLIETNDCSYIFSGQLVDYELSKEGGLDSFSITGVSRIKLSDYEQSLTPNDKKYVRIESHILVLKYKEVKNINLQFFKFIKQENGQLLPHRVS